MVPYGPVISLKLQAESSKLALDSLFKELKRIGKERNCSFVRLSPFWPSPLTPTLNPNPSTSIPNSVPSPLHLLAEHVWYLPLTKPDPWQQNSEEGSGANVSRQAEDELLMAMRKTTRNLIRRAERDGVTIEASSDAIRDLPIFLKLHNETRNRHGFTPYTDTFFRSQVTRFFPRKECTLYLAHFQGEVIAASIHMHIGGETSYHHGASASKFSKVPASYLLQWTAIRDALRRGDHVYNFWGIAPPSLTPNPRPKPHPFAGVTLFKTGFGGNLLTLEHCRDIPLSPKYWLTNIFETIRRWHRGF